MTDIRAAHLDRLDRLSELATGPTSRPRPVLTILRSRVARVIAVAAAATGLLVVLSTSSSAFAEAGTLAPANVQCRDVNVSIVTGDGVRIRATPGGSRIVGYAYRGNTQCWEGAPRDGYSYGSVYGPSGLRGTGWVSTTYLRPDV